MRAPGRRAGQARMFRAADHIALPIPLRRPGRALPVRAIAHRDRGDRHRVRVPNHNGPRCRTGRGAARRLLGRAWAAILLGRGDVPAPHPGGRRAARVQPAPALRRNGRGRAHRRVHRAAGRDAAGAQAHGGQVRCRRRERAPGRGLPVDRARLGLGLDRRGMGLHPAQRGGLRDNGGRGPAPDRLRAGSARAGRGASPFPRSSANRRRAACHSAVHALVGAAFAGLDFGPGRRLVWRRLARVRADDLHWNRARQGRVSVHRGSRRRRGRSAARPARTGLEPAGLDPRDARRLAPRGMASAARARAGIPAVGSASAHPVRSGPAHIRLRDHGAHPVRGRAPEARTGCHAGRSGIQPGP